MPAGTLERMPPSSGAATPATPSGAPGKPPAASEHRKSSKPIMEKRRRARINDSLGQLKSLILDALKKDSSRHSKLEKADILEMTVKHLRNMQRLQVNAAVNADPSVLAKYRDGFSECVGEVTRFLSTCEGVNTEVRGRLLAHLASCVSHMTSLNLTAPRPVYGQIPGAASPPPANALPCRSVSPVSVSPEAVRLYGGLQVVPTPDGHVAFLIPSAALAPLSTQSGHGARWAAAVSPGVGPPVTADSVWRPW